ncbi:MAG: hypothetical protein CMK32_07875 [Porticoccaceae bacterium]|nr:hypothetical protein [Porticoccaceae bacterium]
MGNCYTGQYEGKLMWIHHTHDSSVWPANGLLYASAVLAAQGPEGAAENFCIRWNENAEHGPPSIVPPEPNRASATRLIDFTAITEQSLQDLIDWVEKGIKPIGNRYSYADGKVILADSARERGGIQPVVRVTANGGPRAEVGVGDKVTLCAEAEVLPEAGRIVRIEWDFDGTGTFPVQQEGVDGTSAQVNVSVEHNYDKPGTYFATARVFSHREGDTGARRLLIPNVAQARVVVV